jgi:SAM-dependent methyltransferase
VGHTGWKQPIVYAYDQRERLRFVERRISALGLRPGAKALDFGCGTGDFSRLLLRLGFDVVGYDPYMKPAWSHARFTYIEERQRFMQLRVEFDLIVSVTVLDHVLDALEFEAVLRRLRESSAVGGALLALEYAPDADAAAPAAHQAYRSLATWQSCLRRAGWELASCWPVPHPVDAPSQAFTDYRRSLVTRALGRATAVPGLAPAASWALDARARLALRGAPAHEPAQSPLKLMLSRATEPESVR